MGVQTPWAVVGSLESIQRAEHRVQEPELPHLGCGPQRKKEPQRSRRKGGETQRRGEHREAWSRRQVGLQAALG